MSNIDPPAGWDDVPELLTTQRALAGPGGPMNAPLVALTARTKMLREEVLAASELSSEQLAALVASLQSAIGSASIGFLPAGTGAVAGNVQTELRRRVYPEWFGAIGDGIANDTPAFNRARDYLLSLPTGGVLECNPGRVYAFGSNWNINKQVGKQFCVRMNGATFTKTAGGWSGAIMTYGAATESAGETLELEGPGVFQSVGANSTGLLLRWAGGSEVSGAVSFRNFRNGCYLENSFAVRFSNKCSWLYSDVGAIVCATICHNLVVDGCGFYNNQRDVYFASTAQAFNLSVVNSDLEGKLNPGSSSIVLDAGGACIKIDGCYIESNDGSPLVFGANTEALSFKNNWLGYNAGTQAWANVVNSSCEGNIFWDQQQTLAASCRDFDIGNNAFVGTSNRIFTPWTPVTLSGGFTNSGGSYASAAVRRDRTGVVRLRGMIQAAANGAAFALPAAYRPIGVVSSVGLSAAAGTASLGRVDIAGDGTVTITRASDGTCSLDMVSFTAQQ